MILISIRLDPPTLPTFPPYVSPVHCDKREQSSIWQSFHTLPYQSDTPKYPQTTLRCADGYHSQKIDFLHPRPVTYTDLSLSLSLSLSLFLSLYRALFLDTTYLHTIYAASIHTLSLTQSTPTFTLCVTYSRAANHIYSYNRLIFVQIDILHFFICLFICHQNILSHFFFLIYLNSSFFLIQLYFLLYPTCYSFNLIHLHFLFYLFICHLSLALHLFYLSLIHHAFLSNFFPFPIRSLILSYPHNWMIDAKSLLN